MFVAATSADDAEKQGKYGVRVFTVYGYKMSMLPALSLSGLQVSAIDTGQQTEKDVDEVIDHIFRYYCSSLLGVEKTK